MKCGRLAMIVFGLLLAANVTAQEYICGDIDNDGDGPDIYDLVWMVDWMVTGGPPPDTMIAANVGGCAGVDIHDLWRLTYYLMRDSSAELSCEDIAECEPPTGGVITLDHVDGELYPGVFMSGWYANFYIRVENDLTQNVRVVANGLRIYSPTGLYWLPAVIGVTYGSQHFQLVTSVQYFSWDGLGSDTVGFLASDMDVQGLPTTYDTIAYTIQIDNVGNWVEEGQICIDTCWFPPAGNWKWETDDGSFTPSWDGPHCFDVITCPAYDDWDCDGIWDWLDNCPYISNHYQEDFDGDGIGDVCDPVCCADRGNVDHSEGGAIDIADLVYLVDYMFNGGPESPCEGEANIDGEASIDIADLVYLVDYMFNDGPAPPACN